MASSAAPARSLRVLARLCRLCLLATLLQTVACGPEGLPGGDDAGYVATADPEARGLTEADFPRVREVAPDVYSYEQLRSAGDERFTTVSLIVVTDEGVLVADGQGSEEETARLVATIEGITERPIRHVVISSDHGDHTAGNAAFPADVEFWAHPTSAENLRRASQARDADSEAPAVPLPTRLVSERETLLLGGRRIELLFLGRAHTGGDLVVHLPEEGVLFMSETYLHRVFPAMRTAYPSEWVAMLEAAEAMEVETYIPGHGFVDDSRTLARELTVYREAVERVIAEGRRLHEAGVPVERAMLEADFGELESWSLRASQGPRAIQQVYAELNGELARSPHDGK
jgi:cyclase